MAEIDEFQRDHATVELAIRDLKEAAGMDHVPSGNFSANSACLQCAVLVSVLAVNFVRTACGTHWRHRPDSQPSD